MNNKVINDIIPMIKHAIGLIAAFKTQEMKHATPYAIKDLVIKPYIGNDVISL